MHYTNAVKRAARAAETETNGREEAGSDAA